MELANDLMAGLRSRVNGLPASVAAPGFDWSGLHARLAAAHAARAALGMGQTPPAMMTGGFGNWQSFAAASGNSLPGVNRTDSADGKIPAGIEGKTAGEPVACGRGQQ